MDFERLIENITPEIHANLKRAIELGKWPDGTRLTQEQKEMSLQAVIAYECRHIGEQERVGFIDRGHKAKDESCASHKPEHDEQILNLK